MNVRHNGIEEPTEIVGQNAKINRREIDNTDEDETNKTQKKKRQWREFFEKTKEKQLN